MTRFPSCLVPWLAVVTLALESPVVRAESSQADMNLRDAAAYFNDGVKLSELEHWRAALEQFEHAYAVLPNFRVLYNLAECRYRLGDYAGALSNLKRYLVEGESRLSAARRTEVEVALAAVETRVARLRLSTEPSGAEIRVDGVFVGTTPFTDPVLVNAGMRKVDAEKSGYSNATQFVDVPPQGVTDVAFGLARQPAPTTAVRPLLVRREHGFLDLLVPFTFLGVGAAGIGLGGAFGIDAIAEKAQLDRQCGGRSCPLTSQPLIDDSRQKAALSTVAFAVGLAGVGVGVALLTLGRPSDPRSRAATGSGRFLFGLGPGSAWAGGTF